MPDISMCADRHCPSRQTCYRYRAVPSERQSWFGQGHREAGWAKCGHFVPVTKTDIIRPVENEDTMDVEIIEDTNEPNAWRVEAIDRADGGIEVAIFSGPRAEDRARDFARTYYDATPGK